MNVHVVSMTFVAWIDIVPLVYSSLMRVSCVCVWRACVFRLQ